MYLPSLHLNNRIVLDVVLDIISCTTSRGSSDSATTCSLPSRRSLCLPFKGESQYGCSGESRAACQHPQGEGMPWQPNLLPERILRQEPLKLLRPVQAYPRLSLVRRTIQPFSRKPRGWLLQCGCDISRDGIRLDASEKWFRELFQNSEETFSTICVLGGYYLNRR